MVTQTAQIVVVEQGCCRGQELALRPAWCTFQKVDEGERQDLPVSAGSGLCDVADIWGDRG